MRIEPMSFDNDNFGNPVDGWCVINDDADNTILFISLDQEKCEEFVNASG